MTEATTTTITAVYQGSGFFKTEGIDPHDRYTVFVRRVNRPAWLVERQRYRLSMEPIERGGVVYRVEGEAK